MPFIWISICMNWFAVTWGQWNSTTCYQTNSPVLLQIVMLYMLIKKSVVTFLHCMSSWWIQQNCCKHSVSRKFSVYTVKSKQRKHVEMLTIHFYFIISFSSCKKNKIMLVRMTCPCQEPISLIILLNRRVKSLGLDIINLSCTVQH